MESKLTSCKVNLNNGDTLFIDGNEFKFEYEGSNCIVRFKYHEFNINYIIKFIKPIKKKKK